MRLGHHPCVQASQQLLAVIWEENINSEINRYITWPGQAVGYKIGEIKIKELRKDAENKLGELFDLKQFHEVVLKSAGPMDIVDHEVKCYIEKRLANK